MGIFGKIINPITHGTDLEKARDKYERLRNNCIVISEKIDKDILDLYNIRKESVKQILRVESYLQKLSNCPNILTDGIKRALSFTDNIREAWNWEDSQIQQDNNSATANATLAGAAVGGAIATLAPTVAMSIATTFGTASTGAAISALGGAAATNAALAWLGGGTIAAGGAGMAGGSAFLALMGPIGWAIAGGGMIGSSYIIKKKNDKAISKIEDEYKKLINTHNELSAVQKRLQEIISKTEEYNENICIKKFEGLPLDFNAENYPQEQLFTIVSRAKTLGKISTETILNIQK